MKYLFACFGLIAGLLWSLSPAWGQELGDVRVAVEDRTPEVRQRAIAEGLDQVLVRLTGDKNGAAEAGLEVVRRDPSRWLQQFSYESSDSEDLELLIRFDVPILLRQLEQAGVPVWTTTRPETLLWLVVQRTAGGEILADGSQDPAAIALLQAAEQRGLPVRLPLMDAEDQGRIRAADIRGHFEEVLRRAASRYQSAYNVSAVLYPGATVQLRWRLLEQGRLQESGEISSESEQLALTELIDRVTGRIAPLYTVRAGEAQSYILQVEGVSSLQGWQEVTTHIASLAGVRDVNVAALAGSNLTLELSFSGDAEQIRALLALERRLTECARSFYPADEPMQDQPDQPLQLRFCWQGDLRQ
ncbi:DUF2066 domain-containing protein [Alcanivorax sp. 1008]|uniref:DUF2066 domain-containing protein n=1 Tax=Alcanivorax sp. 1008 TaxID=2816853 RepID=UPI001D6F67A2|nr:DUF2066 domain-containing protein [Alcanivorax sp. 1008]MCC1495661.1 DUF2066 domain-containing protein [Alcanivorax sp. 1008]